MRKPSILRKVWTEIRRKSRILILGVAGPSYTFGEYDPQTQKGSIIVNSNDLNQIWATLSLYGRHLHHNIALQLNSITIPNE
uniref:Uncharacterized protein n=1 Tax=Acrobeloides nanus TaxID=290746 RepID=A0A914CQB9_9BILA